MPNPDGSRTRADDEQRVANALREAARQLDRAAAVAATLGDGDIRTALGDLTAPIANDLRAWAEDYQPAIKWSA
jgi:hypothetical protein